MTKVAIIGCSHSDDCGQQNGSEYVWVRRMGDEYPNIEFHNYSKTGHGALYYDLVLKYMIANNLEYDKVIIQWTGTDRWMHPVQVSQDTDIAFKTTNWWYPNPDTESNITRYRLVLPRKGYNESLPLLNGESYYSDDMGVILHYKGNEQYDKNDINLARFYTNMFMSSLEIYQKYYNIFSFGIMISSVPEIFQDQIPVYQKSLGNDNTFVSLLDDSMHLTSKGNRMLYAWLKHNGLTF